MHKDIIKEIVEKIAVIGSTLTNLQWILYGFIGATVTYFVGLAAFGWNINRDIRKDTGEEIKEIYRRINEIFITISKERETLLDKMEILDSCREENAGNIIRLDKSLDEMRRSHGADMHNVNKIFKQYLVAEKEARENDIKNIIRTCDGCKK